MFQIREENQMKQNRISWTLLAVLLVSTLVLGACAQPAAPTQEPVVPVPGDIACTDVKAGDTLSMLYQWSGEEEAKLTAILAPWSEACGVTVTPESSRDQALLDTRVQAGTPPDITFWNVTQLSQYKHKLIDMSNEIFGNNTFAYYMRDGSLSKGLELITQPATFNAHEALEDKYRQLFAAIKDHGFGSDRFQTCGYHIHFNRGYFSDNDSNKIM